MCDSEERRAAVSSTIHTASLEAVTNKDIVNGVIEKFKTKDKSNNPSRGSKTYENFDSR